jgi:hypothetical protein
MTACGFDRRIPASTRDDVVGQCSPEAVEERRRHLHAQTRTDWRSQSLEPVGLPCGVAAVDNTTLWTGPVATAHDPQAQVVHHTARRAYAQVRAVRTGLIAAASKPAIEQVVIRAETKEGGMFAEVFQVLEANDSALMEIYRMDAGFGSEAKARLVAQAHQGDILGRKGNQPELRREAER